MPSYFTATRNVELSLLYYLETNLTADWSGTTVVKSFKQAYSNSTNLPIVCVRLSDTQSTRREIGSDTLEDRNLLIIDIFCTSDGQRLDMSHYIKDKLKDGWTHYDHSHPSGDNTSLTRVANGRDYVTDFITDSRIEFGENTDQKDAYRHNISVRVRKSS